MFDGMTFARAHAEAAGFVPAHPAAAPLPSVAIGQHVIISPALGEGVRLALFPHASGDTMLTVQAPGAHTALHLSLATLESLATSSAAIVALFRAAAATASGVAEHPDAELLAVCAGLADLQAEWQRLYDATSDEDALTTPADRAWRRYSDDVWPGTAPQAPGSDVQDVPAMLLTMRPTTPEGLAAKAAAILALDQAEAYCGDRGDSLDLCMSVVRDAAGLASRSPEAGAALITTPIASPPGNACG